MKTKARELSSVSSLAVRYDRIVRAVSLLSLIPVGISFLSSLRALAAPSSGLLFVRDPWFLLALSAAFHSLFLFHRLIKGADGERTPLFLIILFVLFSKPLLFSPLLASDVLRSLLFAGYLINMVIALMSVSLVVPFFAVDLIIGAVLMKFSTSLAFLPLHYFIFVLCALAAALLLRKEVFQFRKVFGLYEQARWSASEFVKVNMKMQDSVDRSAFQARSLERDRIAREIHDTVGYTLTALLLQIQANQEVLTAEDDKSILMNRLKSQENLIRTVISDVRKEIRNMRSESGFRLNGKTRWERLCRVFSESTGIRVSVKISDNLEIVSEIFSDNVYRIIQESLTNSYRHGGADYIDISMEWEEREGQFYLRVSDNGSGCSSYEMGSGLRGMRERTKQMGGEIFWQSQLNKGFDIGITLPWEGTNE